MERVNNQNMITSAEEHLNLTSYIFKCSWPSHILVIHNNLLIIIYIIQILSIIFCYICIFNINFVVVKLKLVLWCFGRRKAELSYMVTCGDIFIISSASCLTWWHVVIYLSSVLHHVWYGDLWWYIYHQYCTMSDRLAYKWFIYHQYCTMSDRLACKLFHHYCIMSNRVAFDDLIMISILSCLTWWHVMIYSRMILQGLQSRNWQNQK